MKRCLLKNTLLPKKSEKPITKKPEDTTKRTKRKYEKRELKDTIIGKKFNRLAVIEFSHRKTTKSNRKLYWKCVCNCGKTLIVRGTALRSGQTKSCGCLQKEIVSSRKGKLNATWRHDLTQADREAQKDRNLNPRVRAWIKRVYQRDDYTCQISGRRGIALSAHHVTSWNKSKSQRYLTKNGITISRELHELFHKIYGKGNNTKKQFKEFCENYKQWPKT